MLLSADFHDSKHQAEITGVPATDSVCSHGQSLLSLLLADSVNLTK